MDSLTLATVAVATVASAYMVAKRNLGSGQGGQGGDDGQAAPVGPGAGNTPIEARNEKWAAPAAYAQMIERAERRHGLPSRLLERLLYEESRYRAEIIDGRVRSPAGAVGIAQFMPATAREWNVDPFNPAQSIDGAGRYLAWLRGRLGGWREALAAYNWGIGNVQRRGLIAAPRETSRYVVNIISDVQRATGAEIQ